MYINTTRVSKSNPSVDINELNKTKANQSEFEKKKERCKKLRTQNIFFFNLARLHKTYINIPLKDFKKINLPLE